MRIIGRQNDTKLEILEWLGMEVQPDVISRPFNSWRRAENVDLYVPGSVRKIIGPQLFAQLPSPVVEMVNYIDYSAANYLRRLAISQNGHLYDMVSGHDYGPLGAIGYPWVGLFGGTVASGATEMEYLISTVVGGPPIKWEPVGGVTQVGCSPADLAVAVTPTFAAPNSKAYLMQVGIQYLWTYFNPDTLHESSPSLVDNTAIITPTVNQPPANTPYITQVILTATTPAPAIGNGYTRIRIYRTQDGGVTFFLLPAVYKSDGTNLSDANFSIAIQGATTVGYDGVAAHNIAPAPDQLMTNPPAGAPGVGANDPPPNAVWGAIYGSRMWLVDPDYRRLWFSNIGDFQSYGVFNFFDFFKETNDTLTALAALAERMIVFGKNSARQITGTDFTNFVELAIDKRRGIVGQRAAITDGDKIYGLTAESMVRLTFSDAGPPFLGDKIKPLTDTIQKPAYANIVNMEIDTTQGLLAFAVKINGVTYNDQIILADLSRPSPFTVIKGLPAEVITLRELESGDVATLGQKALYYSDATGAVYFLYTQAVQGVLANTGSLVATLETQELPLEDFNFWREFGRGKLFGSDLTKWLVAAATDYPSYTNFSPLVPIFGQTIRLGRPGQRIVLRFVHASNDGVPALLSCMTLKYENKGSTI